jgi:hypothetical protein
MDTMIKVTHSKVYGVDRYYPANKLAERLAEFCGQASLTTDQLKVLHQAGFTIEQVSKPLTFKP